MTIFMWRDEVGVKNNGGFVYAISTLPTILNNIGWSIGFFKFLSITEVVSFSDKV